MLGAGIHREVPPEGVPRKLSMGRCYSLELATKVPELWHEEVKGKPSTGRSNASYWDSDLRMLGEAARRDMTCSAGAQGEAQVRPGRRKPLPPLVSFQSTPLIKLNLMLVCKGEIFSPALFLHSRQ